jgi:hypothetical protein
MGQCAIYLTGKAIKAIDILCPNLSPWAKAAVVAWIERSDVCLPLSTQRAYQKGIDARILKDLKPNPMSVLALKCIRLLWQHQTGDEPPKTCLVKTAFPMTRKDILAAFCPSKWPCSATVVL